MLAILGPIFTSRMTPRIYVCPPIFFPVSFLQNDWWSMLVVLSTFDNLIWHILCGRVHVSTLSIPPYRNCPIWVLTWNSFRRKTHTHLSRTGTSLFLDSELKMYDVNTRYVTSSNSPGPPTCLSSRPPPQPGDQFARTACGPWPARWDIATRCQEAKVGMWRLLSHIGIYTYVYIIVFTSSMLGSLMNHSLSRLLRLVVRL